MTDQQAATNLEIRYTEIGDAKYLKQWLMEPDISRWFSVHDEVEIEDAVNRWIGFYRYKCSLTATLSGVPCGLATLYLQPYRKLAHQCEFGIIVGGEYRNKGIGAKILTSLIQLAKENFHIELLHLIVHEDNPAIRLYSRFGFQEFGRQKQWVKENNTYAGRVFMEKLLREDLTKNEK